MPMDDNVQIDNNQIEEFVNKMNIIEQMHKEGKLYCVTRSIWNEKRYHSNLVYYSDRLKEQIFNNQEMEITYYDDIYYALIETYIDITGYKLRSMFQLNKSWLIMLDRKLICEEAKKKAFIKIFIRSVLRNSGQDINDIEDIKKLDEYKILIL